VVRAFLERISECGRRLAELYDDHDGTLRDELAAVTGAGITTFQIFYGRLAEMKEEHQRQQQQ
jgi:hypothetical protein